MLDIAIYRRLLLGVALTHIVLVPLVFLLVSFFSLRRRGARGGQVSISVLCTAFATALTGVPALVGGLAWNPGTAVEQMTRFSLLMVISGAIAARLPDLASDLRRKPPFHRVIWSLLAALGDVLAWICLDLLVLSDFTGMYLWLFISVGFPAFLGRLAAHSYPVMPPQVNMRPPLSSLGRMAAPVPRLHSFPDMYEDDFDDEP